MKKRLSLEQEGGEYYMSNLTPKQEKFVQNLIKGMSQRQAYKDAFKVDYDDDAIDSNASTLFKSTKIKQRYDELQNKLEDDTIKSVLERLKYLESIVKGEEKEKDKVVTPGGKVVDVEKETSVKTKMDAVNMINKMTGVYVQKIEADVNNDVHIDIGLSDE
jgi:phage terminase small subunit